ncbi:MAG: Cof-type HAD-IIB family hydrolase [Terriglobales bacterium]
MKRRIRLLAVDIDGTLLNPAFEISADDLAALRRAHESGIEIILVTGRRHTFAVPIAQKLGFYDKLWLISSNGAITRSFAGETFHRDLLPVATARHLAEQMSAFRGNMVITFDQETKGALVLEHTRDLTGSIERWLRSNMEYIEFISPIEQALTHDPVQAMFCGGVKRMQEAQAHLLASEIRAAVTVLRTEYPLRDLCIMDVLNRDCSKGHAVKRWAAHRRLHSAEVMAIGDNYNDVEMLEFAGLPVVMGNASDELKQNGWHVTLGNDQSGVAAALETLVQL